MNENIDLTKILKDCPRGFKLYTPLYGEVSFLKIDKKDSVFIMVRVASFGTIWFTEEGHYFKNATDSECLLLPSKEMRDWSKFTAPWYKNEKFDPKTLQPFDKVLVRDECCEKWRCDLYSHYDNIISYPYVTINSNYGYCIPYNDETKHLACTKDEAPEYYRYWEG